MSHMKSRKLQPCLRSEWGIVGGGGRRKLGKMPEAKTEDNTEQQAGFTSYSHPGRRAAWISPSVLTNRLPGTEDPTHFTETAGVSLTHALSKTPTYVPLFGYCVGNHYLCGIFYIVFDVVFFMHWCMLGVISSNFITVSMVCPNQTRSDKNRFTWKRSLYLSQPWQRQVTSKDI